MSESDSTTCEVDLISIHVERARKAELVDAEQRGRIAVLRRIGDRGHGCYLIQGRTAEFDLCVTCVLCGSTRLVLEGETVGQSVERHGHLPDCLWLESAQALAAPAADPGQETSQ